MNERDRRALVGWAKQTIAGGSRSFGLASKLLPRRERENAWLLYAWCRACDDLTDDQMLGFARPAQTPDTLPPDLWAMTRMAIESDQPLAPPFMALRAVQRDVGLPPDFLFDHLRGFDMDRTGWRPADIDDLVGYCFHVAGAVGLMMAVIMGVDPDDGDTLDRASDLGIAFQLNNIARDIVEDAHIGRCYIPKHWLEKAGMAAEDIPDLRFRPQLAGFAHDLCALASSYDRSARVGAARLPLRCRAAIHAAANIYGAIGQRVVACGAQAWDSRVSTGALRKGAAVGRALIQSALTPADLGRAELFQGDYLRPSDGGSAQLPL